MKVLLVNYRYFVSGGPEKYMFRIKEMLEQNGHEVIPFSIHSNKNVETEYEKYFVEPIGSRDATYYEDVTKTPKTIMQMLTRSIYSKEVKRAIQKEIRETRPDIVYIIHFINKLSPSVITGAKELNVPVVLRLSDYFMLCPRFDFLRDKQVCEECLSGGYHKCIVNRCVKGSLAASTIRVAAMKIHNWMHIYDKVDAFVTPSDFLEKKLIQNGYDEHRIHCIPTFTRSQSKIEKPIIGSYGLYFGRVEVEKGVETVIHAYEKMPDHHVVIMGDDETLEGKRLKQYVNDHHLNNIEFIGHRSGEALEKVIMEARFTLIPSIWYDNLPNTALESFQYSKPIIASNIGSLPELVEDEINGFLFEAGNANELAEKIIKLDDDQLVAEMGKQSFRILKQKFSEEQHYRYLIDLFEEIVNEG